MNDNIINQVGSLTVLRTKLNGYGIHRFELFNEISKFINNYEAEINECINKNITQLNSEIEEYEHIFSNEKNEYEQLINTRRIEIEDQIKNNEIYINREIKPSFFYPLKVILIILRKRKNRYLKENFEIELRKPYKDIESRIVSLEKQIETCTTDFNAIIERRSAKQIADINYTLDKLKELEPIYYGAIGELKALKRLENLPKSFYIINDYQIRFQPPIYDKRNNDRIYSIQVDHIVIGPTGVFIIETKNWSQESIQSRDLFSPINQLKRSSFALFVILNNMVTEGELKSFNIDWGNKKISPKNILLMINSTTTDKFQFVKVTSLDSINKYILNQSEELNEHQIKELVRVLSR